MLFRQDDRHPGVDFPHKFVWFARDDRASVNPFIVSRIVIYRVITDAYGHTRANNRTGRHRPRFARPTGGNLSK